MNLDVSDYILISFVSIIPLMFFSFLLIVNGSLTIETIQMYYDEWQECQLELEDAQKEVKCSPCECKTSNAWIVWYVLGLGFWAMMLWKDHKFEKRVAKKEEELKKLEQQIKKRRRRN